MPPSQRASAAGLPCPHPSSFLRPLVANGTLATPFLEVRLPDLGEEDEQRWRTLPAVESIPLTYARNRFPALRRPRVTHQLPLWPHLLIRTNRQAPPAVLLCPNQSRCKHAATFIFFFLPRISTAAPAPFIFSAFPFPAESKAAATGQQSHRHRSPDLIAALFCPWYVELAS
jgi:hypothetical protein